MQSVNISQRDIVDDQWREEIVKGRPFAVMAVEGRQVYTRQRSTSSSVAVRGAEAAIRNGSIWKCGLLRIL